MQLFIILALLLYGGKSNAQSLLQEVRPVLESLGGEQVQEALKSAEQISEMLTAVNAFSANAGGGQSEKPPEFSGHGEERNAFPLEPISKIADRDITYSLSKYIAEA